MALQAVPVTDGHRGSDGRGVIEIDGIGPVLAETISAWVSNPSNLDLLSRLRAAGVDPVRRHASAAVRPPVCRQDLVVTGRLDSMSRPEAQSKIKSLGGKASSSVSRKTDYLVAGADAGSKHATAVRLGVTVLDEEQFLRVTERRNGRSPAGDFRRRERIVIAKSGGSWAVTFRSLLDRLFPTKGSAEEPAFENPWIVLGLGNPGPEYRDTRHNAGHWCVQRLAEETGTVLENRRLVRTSQIHIAGHAGVLALSRTYVNLSGEAAGVSAHTIRGRPRSG